MSASNHRNCSYMTCHHLTSRIAHRVFFMEDDERNDFVEMMRRCADFSGILLVGWCIMSNHFHILAYLPEPVQINEAEVIRRYGVLKGKAAASDLERQLAAWRKAEGGDALVEAKLNSIRRRMYSIGTFMKILKQWFTAEYNRRHSHVGTLWESAYKDRIVGAKPGDRAKVLGYIHLNPIHAAAAKDYDEYRWSSFTAAARKDEVAIRGMRFVYGKDGELSAIMDAHRELLDSLLEDIKRKRAEDIARRRAAGYAMPTDHLTDEAMVAQAIAHADEVQRAKLEFDALRRHQSRYAIRRGEIEKAIEECPAAGTDVLSKMVGAPVSTVYQYLRTLKAMGVIARERRGSPWCVNYEQMHN